MTSPERTSSRPTAFAIFTIVAGVVGWFASFELLTEYIKTLQNSDYVPNCSVSVLVTCGPNMDSWQGSVFGFSNTVLGVAGFMAPIIVGAALLARARFATWFWSIYMLGITGAVVFVTWLQYQSIFRIGTLCPWCMVVWAATIPLFWISLVTLSARGHLGSGMQRTVGRLQSWTWVFIAVHVVVLAGIAQIALDWFNEFSLL